MHVNKRVRIYWGEGPQGGYSTAGRRLIERISKKAYRREQEKTLNDSGWEPRPIKKTILWDAIICAFAYVGLVAFPTLFGLMYRRSLGAPEDAESREVSKFWIEFWGGWHEQVEAGLGAPDLGLLLTLAGGFSTLIIAAIFSGDGNFGPAAPIMYAVEISGYLTGIYAVHSILSPISAAWGQPVWQLWNIGLVISVGCFALVSILRNSAGHGGIGFRFRDESEVSYRSGLYHDLQTLDVMRNNLARSGTQGDPEIKAFSRRKILKSRNFCLLIRSTLSPLLALVLVVLTLVLSGYFGTTILVIALSALWQLFIYYFHWDTPSWRRGSGFARLVVPAIVGVYVAVGFQVLIVGQLFRVATLYSPNMGNSPAFGLTFQIATFLALCWFLYDSYWKAWKSFLNSSQFLQLKYYILRRRILSSLRRSRKNHRSAPGARNRVSPKHRRG